MPRATLHDNRCYVDYRRCIDAPQINTPVVPAPLSGRRAELAAAAYSMIAERGVEGLSLRALARDLGATTGLVSHYFLNRTELVQAALDHSTAVMLQRIGAVGTSEPLGLLEAVLPTDEASAENWRFALSVRCAALFDPELERFDRAIAEIWSANLPQLLEGDFADPDGASLHLVALVDGIALHAVLDAATWTPRIQHEQLVTGYESLRAMKG